MEEAAQGGRAGGELLSGSNGGPDFDFLPHKLRNQCRSLIESYHDLHGYGCLPDILWKAGLGPFIETHREFRQLLRKASMTRSAKKSNEGFTQIATTLLSLEDSGEQFCRLEYNLSTRRLHDEVDFEAACPPDLHAVDGILSVSAEVPQFGGDRDAGSSCHAGRCRNRGFTAIAILGRPSRGELANQRDFVGPRCLCRVDAPANFATARLRLPAIWRP